MNDDIQIHTTQAEIFDRWGNMAFESTAIPVQWNGEFNGTPLYPGVFVYRIELKYYDGVKDRMVLLTGDVNLFR